MVGFKHRIWPNRLSLVFVLLFTCMVVKPTMAQTCLSPPSHIVNWWPGDGNANDIAGSNHGILQNGTAFVSALVDQTFSFDGVDDFVNLTSPINPGASSLTIDAWVNVTAFDQPGSFNGLTVMGADNGTPVFELQLLPDFFPSEARRLHFFARDTRGNSLSLLGTSMLAPGMWHHVALTWDVTTSSAVIYVNGVPEAAAGNINIDPAALPAVSAIGVSPRIADTQPFLGFFYGLIDEVDIYNRALSQAEIQDIFNAGSTGKCKFPAQDFPRMTSASQEIVRDGADADATAIYSIDGSVVLANGEMRLDRADLRIPGRGQIHFNISRRYRSQLDYDGPLGHGWDFSYNERLLVLSNGDVARSNGWGHVTVWTRNVDGSFTAPTGYFGTLREENDGSFTLRETDGFKRIYSADGQLLSHEDRFGSVMAFTYDAPGNLTLVTDAFARQYTLIYQTIAGRDRLVTLRDYAGREVIYDYDAQGDLVAVRSPTVTGTSIGNDFPQGRTEAYTYMSGAVQARLNHNLMSVTYPEEVAANGPPALSITYGDSGLNLDRVLAVTLGGVNTSGIQAGGTATFDYVAVNQNQPAGNADLVRLEVHVTERNGNLIDFDFNEFGHNIVVRHLTRGLRANEPSGFETRNVYDDDGQLLRQTLSQGNEHRYLYDVGGPRAAQRNVIEIRHVADNQRGVVEDLVTSMTYEPLFNQLASITDPRGNATGFVPPIGTTSPARYTTRYFYDYQENNNLISDVVTYGIDVSGIARGLGDLNDDGRTDQLTGNRVRTLAPIVLLPDGSTQTILTETQWNNRGQEIGMIDPEGNLTTYTYYPEYLGKPQQYRRAICHRRQSTQNPLRLVVVPPPCLSPSKRR